MRIFIIIFVFLILLGDAVSVTWQDNFAREAEENWQQEGNDSVWRIEDGFLWAEIRAQQQWHTIFELYQFIAYPGPYDDFTITLETIGAAEARFGIALAKHFLNPVAEIDEHGYYLFFTNDMQASRNGGVFVTPGQRWNTDELQQMELHFKGGRFQLRANGESRVDFRDANFDHIDIIAFVLAGFVADNVSTGSAWVDTFTISGLAVSPKRKLATTWAHLKQEQ